MDWAASILVAVGLAMDAFAVSLGVSTTGQARDFRSGFRLAFHFGLFQSLMAFLGWLLGSTIASLIANFDHWVAFALLAYVGINMIRSGLSQEKERVMPNPSRGRMLVILAVATSLDAMAVGLSMAMIGGPVALPIVLIGVVTLTLSTIGILTGNKLGEKFGKRMEIIGGVILITIGVRVVISHLFGI
jgi:putative Mn2+ efflux pump MntP